MGIFGSKKLNIHCDNCKKKINDYEFVWINEHKFCQACAAKIQGGAPNVLVQSGQELHGLNSDSHNYEMNIDDIFFVNNKGTVLCGTVKKGAVRLNDIVCIGNKRYNVIGIECSGTLLTEALCGMNIGLLIECLTPHIFSVGTVVTGLPEEKEISTEKPVPTVRPLDSGEISELKRYALKFLPETMDTPAAYKSVIEKLSAVIPTINISIMDMKIQNIMETNTLADCSIGDFYIMLADEVEKWIGVTNIEKVMQTVVGLDDDGLLGVWISLDMFGFALKDRSKDAVDGLCNSVLEIISQRGIRAPKPVVTAPEVVQPTENAENVPVPENTTNSGPANPEMPQGPQTEETSEFEILQKRCFDLAKVVPGSEELMGLKARLGQMILGLDEIWVAYDEDFKGIYPYVSSNGRMEIFTKKEYADAAKNYYASCHEAHMVIKSHAKDEIKKFFDDMLYMGIVYFILDNGVAAIDMSIESFVRYDGIGYLDKKNRAIRCYLMRYMQTLYRYNKISDAAVKEQRTKEYQNILSAYLSAGATALANGVVYALGPGPYAEGISLYTDAALEKLKSYHNKNGIFDEEYMVCPGDTNYATVGSFDSVETIKNPALGDYVAVFTDKPLADKVRLDFKNYGPEYDYNIIAMTFDEVVKYALGCDGMIVDVPTYGHIIEKSKLTDIISQASAQQ